MRLFVGNLSFQVSEAELQTAFAPFGATGVAIPTNESGRPKGFGFVDVADDQADDAIREMNGKELRGRAIAVNEARPRTAPNTWGGDRGGRGGGGRGGGGRGDYGGGGGRGDYGGGGRGGRW